MKHSKSTRRARLSRIICVGIGFISGTYGCKGTRPTVSVKSFAILLMLTAPFGLSCKHRRVTGASNLQEDSSAGKVN